MIKLNKNKKKNKNINTSENDSNIKTNKSPDGSTNNEETSKTDSKTKSPVATNSIFRSFIKKKDQSEISSLPAFNPKKNQPNNNSSNTCVVIQSDESNELMFKENFRQLIKEATEYTLSSVHNDYDKLSNELNLLDQRTTVSMDGFKKKMMDDNKEIIEEVYKINTKLMDTFVVIERLEYRLHEKINELEDNYNSTVIQIEKLSTQINQHQKIVEMIDKYLISENEEIKILPLKYILPILLFIANVVMTGWQKLRQINPNILQTVVCVLVALYVFYIFCSMLGWFFRKIF